MWLVLSGGGVVILLFCALSWLLELPNIGELERVCLVWASVAFFLGFIWIAGKKGMERNGGDEGKRSLV